MPVSGRCRKCVQQKSHPGKHKVISALVYLLTQHVQHLGTPYTANGWSMSGVLVIAMLLDHYKACRDYLQAKRPDLGTSITYKKHTLSRGGLGLPNPQGTAGSKNEDSAMTTESKSTNKNLTSQFTKKKTWQHLHWSSTY